MHIICIFAITTKFDKRNNMREIFELVNQMSPYLLLGFLLAGIMHAFVPQAIYKRYLGNENFNAVLNATLLGIPLPLCSCGVIPTAMSLRREGASRGATVAFLIATPQTGVDSIFATYSLMGLPFAIVRPIAALVTALIGGQAATLFGKDRKEIESAQKPDETTNSQSKRFVGRIGVALKYAYFDMMQDIGKWLVIGLLIAGAITVFVPESFFAHFSDNSLLSILLVLVCAIPMYLCATGSIPIAVALMLKGLSPGTALVLLMAGPAANAASILVLNKVMGARTMAIYLASIIGGAVAFGLAIDYLLPREWFTAPIEAIATCHHSTPSYFNLICTILLTVLLINALAHRYLRRQKGCEKSCDCTQKPIAEPTVIHIEGMRCNHCRANVEKAIAAIEGVETVSVDLVSGNATITGNPSIEAVEAAIKSLGFKVG